MDAWHKSQLQSIAKLRRELTNGAQKRRSYQRGYIEGRRDESDGKALPHWVKLPH